MSGASPRDLGLDRLIELAKEEAASPVDAAVDRVGRARLVERIVRAKTHRGLALRWFGPVPMFAWVMVAVCVVGGFAWGLASRPIGFVVRGVAKAEPYVRAADNRPVDVDFSDGTRIHADVGARLRIEDRSSHGARILLERGRASVQVARRARADWSFVAGPFDVQVKGTRFVLNWDPIAEQLDLKLEEGSVEVVGPLGPRQVAVRAGQQLVANLSKRSLTLSETSPAGTAAEPPLSGLAGVPGSASSGAAAVGAGDARAVLELAPSPSSLPGTNSTDLEAPLAPEQAGGSAAASAPTQLSWSKLLAKGQFETIVRLAESKDRPRCAEHCSAPDLRALAEAARYTGRPELAETALLALRQRFPDHPESKKAAFLLGRIYEARADRGRAEIWYRTYSNESPQSELASDALAGQMRVVRRARGSKAAEPLAQEYLRRFPGGVHASAAQEILRELR